MMQESQPSFDNQPDSGVRMDQDFRNESVRLKAKIISSQYKEYLEPLLETYDFSQQCKITLKNIINVCFDPNAMLARNESIEMRTMLLEIELNLARVAMDESDTQNPGLLTITEAIINAFKDFISPSLGGRVRDRITIEESEHHASYSGLPPNQGMDQSGERRGLFNRGPGR
jgi:hypothetical protein